MQKIGLISDTHGFLDDKIKDFIGPCDQIWHAGDIGKIEILEELERLKPVKAVYGNIDNHIIRADLPRFQHFRCEGKSIFITHIGGYPGNYEKGITDILKNKDIDIFICGHSHILKVMPDKKYDLLHINPGACGLSGFHKFRTAVRFKITKNEIKDMEILEIPRS